MVFFSIFAITLGGFTVTELFSMLQSYNLNNNIRNIKNFFSGLTPGLLSLNFHLQFMDWTVFKKYNLVYNKLGKMFKNVWQHKKTYTLTGCGNSLLLSNSYFYASQEKNKPGTKINQQHFFHSKILVVKLNNLLISCFRWKLLTSQNKTSKNSSNIFILSLTRYYNLDQCFSIGILPHIFLFFPIMELLKDVTNY